MEEALHLEMEVLEQPKAVDVRHGERGENDHGEYDVAMGADRSGWPVEKKRQSELEGGPAVAAEGRAVGRETTAAELRCAHDPLGQRQRLTASVHGLPITDGLTSAAPAFEVVPEQGTSWVGGQAQADDEATKRVEPSDVPVFVQ